jgi:hypothetical protein
MWFNKQIKDCIVLACKPQGMACAYIKKKDMHTPYTIDSYTYIPLTNLELEKQIIFNPTAISKQLNTLLQQYKKTGAQVRISLEGPTIFEKFVPSEIIAENTYGDQLKDLLWQEMPASTSHTYLCGISRELLFQYQLLAIANKLKITCITTSTMALLASCQKFAPHNDNQISCLHDIHNFIATQNIAALCSHVPSTDDPVLMAELIGLCMAELSYENN